MSVWLPSLQFSLHVCVQTKYLGQKRTYMHTWFAAGTVVRGARHLEDEHNDSENSFMAESNYTSSNYLLNR